MTTGQTGPRAHPGGLLLPAGTPRAFAVYAFRGQPGRGPEPDSAVPAALAAAGIAVLAAGLGPSAAPASPSGEDGVTAVRRAAAALRASHGAPSLLIGHSAAGPAVLAAAGSVAGVRAVVTIGSPAPPSPPRLRAPLLVLHAPGDPVVPAAEASRVFAAGHPASFRALAGADHAVSDPRQAERAAALITTWAEPYLPAPAPAAPLDADAAVVVTEAGPGRYRQVITAGKHRLTADEPASAGGTDTGPSPYELLLAALGACTSITLRMYADRKGLPLERTTVRLRHDRSHAKDCAHCDKETGMLPRIRRELGLEGPLTDEDRRRLVEIADRCPVHRTLSSQIAFETTQA